MSILGGITRALFGGGDQTTTTNVAPASQQEKDIFNNLLAQSQTSASPTASSEQQIQQAFKNALAQYLASTTNGAPDPAVLQRATDYVDATFTNPAQASFDKFQRQYIASQNEQAAKLGRSPMDSAIQQQNFRTLADINANIGAQRGSLIAQRSNQIPMQNLSFINDLNQQAFQNRNSLLNLQSGLYKGLQNERLAAAGKTVQGQDLGIVGNLTQLGKGYQAFTGGENAPSKGIASLFG